MPFKEESIKAAEEMRAEEARENSTYWAGKGKHQEAAMQLSALLPSEGSVVLPKKNKALELYRRASNCYYDLYNNGLCNRTCEFRRVFGISSSKYKIGRGKFSPELYTLVEAKMDSIIEAASAERAVLLANYQH